jgi:uncharacterized repeat protein (TIGR01451 family)
MPNQEMPLAERIPAEELKHASSQDVPSGRQEPSVSLEWIGPAALRLGQAANYQIVVRNVSPGQVHQVVVRSKIPGGVVVKSTEPRGTQDAGHLVWELGTMQSRQEPRLNILLLPESKGDLDCQAHVTFTGSSSTKLKVREPKLAVKVAGTEKVALGDSATVTLTVSNPGDGVAEHVKVKAQLPEGLEHSRGQTVEFELGNLGPNESRNVQLVCATKMAGQHICQATATGEGNLSAQATVTVEVILPRLDLTVSGPKLRYLDRNATYVLLSLIHI